MHAYKAWDPALTLSAMPRKLLAGKGETQATSNSTTPYLRRRRRLPGMRASDELCPSRIPGKVPHPGHENYWLPSRTPSRHERLRCGHVLRSCFRAEALCVGRPYLVDPGCAEQHDGSVVIQERLRGVGDATGGVSDPAVRRYSPALRYRCTSLIRPPPVGPYSSPVPRDLW